MPIPTYFECTCTAIFTSSKERDAHLTEESSKNLRQRELASNLSQHLEQALSHSKAEDPAQSCFAATVATENALKKHQNQEGYQCPFENCCVKPMPKLRGFREHCATRMTCNSHS